jgi:hypothetical protein
MSTLPFEDILKTVTMKGVGYLYGTAVAHQLSEFISNGWYNGIDPGGGSKVAGSALYYENNDLWTAILGNDLFLTKRVRLCDFCVLEWLPGCPGLYFTEEAERARNDAEYSFNSMTNEYLPLGKLRMIEGGIGSVRLIPKNEGDKYLLGASSNGISHQGIPLVLSPEVYSQCIEEISEHGYLVADVIGTIVPAPPAELLFYKNNIPKYAVSVDRIERKKSVPVDVQITVNAIYSTDREFKNPAQTLSKYTFKTFTPDKREKNLEAAVQWIEDHAARYSNGEEFWFLSDFDQKRGHFSAPVKIPVIDVMQKQIKQSVIQEISNSLNTIIINNNISGNFAPVIVGAGDVSVYDSFNTKYGTDFGYALQKISELISESGNIAAKEEFEKLKGEFAEPMPRSRVLRSAWDRLVAFMPAVRLDADIYTKIEPLFQYG